MSHLDFTDLAPQGGELVQVSRHLPIDDIEPIESFADEVRAARVKAVALLNQSFAQVEAALTRPNASIQGALTVLYGIAYALGLNICGELTVSARAELLGIERATLSKIMVAFASSLGLEPSHHMKSMTARASYSRARRRSIQLNGQSDAD